MMVSDVLGRERLDALLAEGKSKDDIRLEAKGILEPLKTSLGDDVFEAFKSKGVPYAQMKEYADYQVQKAKDADKAAEEKAHNEKVANLTKGYEKRFEDDSFTGRLKKGALRVGSELDVLTDYVNPFRDKDERSDPETVAFLQAAENMDEKFKKKAYTPEENIQNEINKKAFANANTTGEILSAGAKDVYFNVTHPAGWDMAGLTAELLNPLNAVGVGAGAVAGKVATKLATKAAVGAAVGAGTEGVINAGYEAGVSLGRGQSEEEAKKAALLGGAFGAAFGGVTGGAGGALYGRWSKPKAKTSTDVSSPNQPAQTIETMPGTVMGKDEFNLMSEAELLKEVDPNYVEIPDDIKNSTLLKVVEAEDHSAQADMIITDLSAQVTDPQARDALIAKHIPATEAEAELSLTINGGMKVHDRLAGARGRTALEKTILQGTDTPESLNAKLAYYGFNDEHRAKIVEAYVENDIAIYDTWVADKIEQRAKGETNARIDAGDGREDLTGQTDRADNVDAGARETVEPDTEPKTIPELEPRDREDISTTRRDTGNVDTEDGILTKPERVDGRGTTTEDAGVVSRTGKNELVQNEDGLRVDGEVETPTQTYARLKDEPALSTEEKTRLQKLSDEYENKLIAKQERIAILDEPIAAGKIEFDQESVKNPQFSKAGETDHIKKLSDLTSHRYFDDVVTMIKSEIEQVKQRVKRVTPSEKKIELEKLGWHKSEDRYKAEMQKFFKKNQEKDTANFNTYSKKEMQLIETGKIDRPLAVKLKQDLQAYAANPLFKRQREEIDSGTRAFASEIEILKQLELDEVLDLVESDSFKRGFDEPMSVDDMVSAIDEITFRDEHKPQYPQEKYAEVVKDIDALYGSDTHIKLSQAQEKAVQSVKDPMKRTVKRRKFEHKELKNRLKRAKAGKNKGAITKAQNNLSKFEDEFVSDGKIKKVGEC